MELNHQVPQAKRFVASFQLHTLNQPISKWKCVRLRWHHQIGDWQRAWRSRWSFFWFQHMNFLRLISSPFGVCCIFWMAQMTHNSWNCRALQHYNTIGTFDAANPGAAGSSPVVARPMVVGFACWLSNWIIIHLDKKHQKTPRFLVVSSCFYFQWFDSSLWRQV